MVEEAATKLNFSANPSARALPTGRTGNIGLIVADITNPSYFDIIRGAQAAADSQNCTLILADSTESAATEATIAQRLQAATDGIILASPRMSDPDISTLAEQKPVALINRYVEGVPSVIPDVDTGIRETVRHMVSHGHMRIAFLAGPEQAWMSRRRWESLLSACQWSHREATLIPTSTPTVEGGQKAARDVLASGATAALCYNDLLAIGLMQELQAAGFSIPEDFSITGFDNIFGSDFTTPALTTITWPLRECGATALNSLTTLLANAGQHRPPKTATGTANLKTSLLVRDTTGRSKGIALQNLGTSNI